MANLFTVPAGKLNAFIGQLAEAGCTAEMVLGGDKNPKMVQAMVDAARKYVEEVGINPYLQTVDEQIKALRMAIREEGWDISVQTIIHLLKNAPDWPKGRDSYRSFRIRFGEGDDGVASTFEAHIARIERVYGATKLLRCGLLRSDKAHLRLLSGNASHKPIVEWAIVHLDANRKRPSIEDVRGPKSLADEGLVMAWLFPERVQAIDDDKWCAWFCAGYELNVPEGGESWQRVPCVNRGFDTGGAHLHAYWRSSDGSGYSVPVSGE
jgi:hypothetical protein